MSVIPQRKSYENQGFVDFEKGLIILGNCQKQAHHQDRSDFNVVKKVLSGF